MVQPLKDDAVRYCRICQRDTPQLNAKDCLDATRWVCTVCDGSELVATEPARYGRDR